MSTTVAVQLEETAEIILERQGLRPLVFFSHCLFPFSLFLSIAHFAFFAT